MFARLKHNFDKGRGFGFASCPEAKADIYYRPEGYVVKNDNSSGPGFSPAECPIGQLRQNGQIEVLLSEETPAGLRAVAWTLASPASKAAEPRRGFILVADTSSTGLVALCVDTDSSRMDKSRDLAGQKYGMTAVAVIPVQFGLWDGNIPVVENEEKEEFVSM
jgi:hypothetical protein